MQHLGQRPEGGGGASTWNMPKPPSPPVTPGRSTSAALKARLAPHQTYAVQHGQHRLNLHGRDGDVQVACCLLFDLLRASQWLWGASWWCCAKTCHVLLPLNVLLKRLGERSWGPIQPLSELLRPAANLLEQHMCLLLTVLPAFTPYQAGILAPENPCQLWVPSTRMLVQPLEVPHSLSRNRDSFLAGRMLQLQQV